MDAGVDQSAEPESRSTAVRSAAEAQHGLDPEFDALLRVLTKALRALGEAGEPESASRLAAQGWSAIRHTRPAAAERLNGTMHYLARLPDPTNTPHRGHPAAVRHD